MKKRKMLFGATLLCIAGLAAYGHIRVQSQVFARGVALPSTLKVEIKPAKTVVKSNEDFSVVTLIRNDSGNDQSIWVLYCAYSTQWRTDNPSVHLDSIDVCAKNVPWKVNLKPGKAYEKEVLVRVTLPSGNDQPESTTFRLGFEDMANTGTQNTRRVWSNAVTVTVTRLSTSMYHSTH